MVPYFVIRFIDTIFSIIEIAIIAECIFSWFPQSRNNQFIELIRNFTYPILQPFRKIQDRFISGLQIDLSPILAIFILGVIRRVIIGILL